MLIHFIFFSYQQVCHLVLYHLNFASDDPSPFMSFRLYVVKSYMLYDFHNHINILALVQVVCDCAIYIHPIILTILGCLSVCRMYAFNLITYCDLPHCCFLAVGNITIFYLIYISQLTLSLLLSSLYVVDSYSSCSPIL